MNGSDETKEALYRLGLKACQEFLQENFLMEPLYFAGRAPHAMNKWQNIGLCIEDKIWVDISLTSLPAYNKGRAWSWPGYKTDRTATGVLAHETGHFIEWLIRTGLKDGRGKPVERDWIQKRFSIAVKQEKPISGYKPHILEEAFAEAMRLYITNPDLLAAGRPLRYELIRWELGLIPVGGPWREMLKEAPMHIRQASANFAKETL